MVGFRAPLVVAFWGTGNAAGESQVVHHQRVVFSIGATHLLQLVPPTFRYFHLN